MLSLQPIQTVVANFHQGNERFSDESKGRQCTANCLLFCATLHVESVQDICADTLDNVLIMGDAHYLKSAKYKTQTEPYLQVIELHPFVKLNGANLKLVYTENQHTTISGMLCDSLMTLPVDAVLLDIHHIGIWSKHNQKKCYYYLLWVFACYCKSK